MVSADVEETSFHKFYSRSIFKHGQRPNVQNQGPKVSPTDQTHTFFGHQAQSSPQASTMKDSLDPEAPEWQEQVYFDNHYSPTTPENYIQLR